MSVDSFKAALFYAYKDILKNKKFFSLIILIIAFTFANLLFIPAIIDGKKYRFEANIYEFQTSHIVILPEEGEEFIENVAQLEKKLFNMPGVEGISPRLTIPITILYKEKYISYIAKGIHPDKESRITDIVSKIVAGNYLTERSREEILLGRKIADELVGTSGDGKLVELGEKVTLVFPNGVRKEYKVKGILSTGNPEVDGSVFINLNDAQSTLEIGNKASEVSIRLNRLEDTTTFKFNLLKLGITDGEVKSWSEYAYWIQDYSKAFEVITRIISIAGATASGVVIAIIVYINTEQKKRKIAILRAIGFRSEDIMIIFILEITILVVIGLIVGYSFLSFLIGYFSTNPIKMPTGDLIPILDTKLIFEVSLLLLSTSLLATILPVYIASKRSIVENLRGE